MTNEELVEKLRFCAAGKCTERECGAENCWDNLMYDAADAIEELTDTNVGKWISVSERMPDKGGRYLIVCGNGLVTTEEFMVWPDRVKTYYDWTYCGGVKYWMGIPEPPSEFFESLKTGLEQAINGETREMTIEVDE